MPQTPQGSYIHSWTANKLLKGAGAGADPTEVDMPSEPGHNPASVGDVLIISADTERSTGSDNALIKSIRLARNGTYRIKFDMHCTEVGYPARASVRRNGVAVGAEQTINQTNYATKSQDIDGWTTGDLCQLYSNVLDGTLFVQNFRIYADTLDVDAVITD